MMRLTATVKRCFAALLISSMLLVAGCGDKEPQQRSAFIIYLQTEVVNKNRINLSVITDSQKDQFGDYAAGYQLLSDFNEDFNGIFSGSLGITLHDLKLMNGVTEMMANQANIEKALKEAKDAQNQLEALYDKTERQKAQLTYPEDASVTFDLSYKKVVTQRADIVMKSLPALIQLFEDASAVIEFVNSQGDKVTVLEHKLEFTDQDAVDNYNQLNQKMQASAVELQKYSVQQW